MSGTTLPHSVWSGTFTVMGVELVCHVLDDGRRIIEQDGMDRLMNILSGHILDIDPEKMEAEMQEFAKWQRG